MKTYTQEELDLEVEKAVSWERLKIASVTDNNSKELRIKDMEEIRSGIEAFIDTVDGTVPALDMITLIDKTIDKIREG